MQLNVHSVWMEPRKAEVGLGMVSVDVDLGAQLDKQRRDELARLHRQLCASFTGDTDSFRGRKWAWLNPVLTVHRWQLDRRIDELLKDQIRRELPRPNQPSAEDLSVCQQRTTNTVPYGLCTSLT